MNLIPQGRLSQENTKGKHAGDSVALDHILPRAVVPELAARFCNLEAIPAKSAKIGQRELNFARRWQRDGLLSAEGLKAVEDAAKRPVFAH